jgi:hypothetical protein
MKIKSSGLVKDFSKATLTSRNERSLSPLLKLKEKLSDNFMHFLKKHRFSAVMVGNTLFQGKTGNFYINMKNNKEQLQNFNPEFLNLNNSNVLKTLENSQANEKQDKGFNDRDSINNIDSLNQSLNQSLDESGSKFFLIFLFIFLSIIKIFNQFFFNFFFNFLFKQKKFLMRKPNIT